MQVSLGPQEFMAFCLGTGGDDASQGRLKAVRPITNVYPLVSIVPRAVPRELGPRAWVGGLRVVGRRLNGRCNEWVEVERVNGECVGGGANR